MIDDLHRQRVLNFLELFYAGDIEGALSRCTDDVDFFANAPIDILPHMGHHRGKDELRTMWQTVHARYSKMRYEVPILVAEGEGRSDYPGVLPQEQQRPGRAIRYCGFLYPS
jgi:uncharacterized protein